MSDRASLEASRRLWAATQLAADVTAFEGLSKGLPVPRSRLNPAALEAIGEPVEGPPLSLDDAKALRLELASGGRLHGLLGDSFRLEVLTARAIGELADPPETDMLVGPLVVRGNRTIIVGDTGHGKTTLALQLAAGALTELGPLGYEGAGVGPVLIVDLEQGRRSIKRQLCEAGVADREDVFVVCAPDGLSLGEAEHRAELERIIAELRPAIFVLDPYYKAHRADANEERGVVDLMRYLDGLRAAYGFALVLPAHPRKDPNSNSVRKLTLHDVAGSGAIVRGAELVLGLERLSHGYARLRILKDRDGDLPVGEAWPLIFTRGEGFKLEPKEERTAEELEERILDDTSDEWRTVKEWAVVLGVREKRARTLLEQLVESGHMEVEIGPAGRSPKARCYRVKGTAPRARAQSGAVTQSPADSGTAPTAPDSVVGTVGAGRSRTTAPDAGAVVAERSSPGPRNPIRTAGARAGEEGFVAFIRSAYRAGHITHAELLERLRVQRILLRALPVDEAETLAELERMGEFVDEERAA